MRVIIIFLLAIISIQMSAQPKPPVATKYPKTLESNGDKRIDNYYWMNDYWLKGPRSEEVVKYLEEENAYYNESMKHTEALQKKLYDEMLARIKQTDESLPYFKNGYWYITKTEQG